LYGAPTVCRGSPIRMIALTLLPTSFEIGEVVVLEMSSSESPPPHIASSTI
jgi:hypothetical protein